MAKMLELVRMLTSTSGTGGPLQLTTPLARYRSADAAGAADGDTYCYSIFDVSGIEHCEGVYDATNKRITRVTLSSSASANAPLNLTSGAVVSFAVGKKQFLQFSESQSLSSAEKSQACANIGLGAVATSGAYADLSGTPTIPDVQKDVRTLSLLISELKGDRINVIGGVVDPLQDTSDVNIASSTNVQTGSGCVKPTAVAGTSLVPTMTGYTSGGITVSASSEYGAGYEAWRAFDGSVAAGTTLWNTAAGVTSANLKVDFGSGTAVGSYSLQNCSTSDAAYAPKSWTFEGSNNNSAWTVLDTVSNNTNVTPSALQTFMLAGGAASYRYYRLNITASNGTTLILGEWRIISPTVPNNMTVKSNAFSFASVPASARLLLQVNPIDAITINTHLIGKVSRDGGTTFATATLALINTLADGTKEYEDAAINVSGQPSGSSMVWRVESAGNKNVELCGVGMWGL